MREILFRGIDEGTNEWVYGFYLERPSEFGGEKRYYIFDDKTISKYNVYPETVGQFIGLIDVNGKKIFEGDYIVCRQAIEGNFIDEHIEMGYVEMKHGAFGLHRKQGYYRPFKDWLEDYEYEVLGNIHDNPDCSAHPKMMR